MNKNLIFVTGAPRSGTTPSGFILSQGTRNSLLYEIFGPTGDIRNVAKYPMIDVNIDRKLVHAILDDIASAKFKLKKQIRPTHSNEKYIRRLALKALGTQTKRSALKIKFNPAVQNIIVKDPHLAFMSADLAEMGYKVVVTYRSALAQASSFKRLNWEPNIQAIYKYYSVKFGRDELIEYELNINKNLTNAIKSTMLWRMIYSSSAKLINSKNAYIIKASELESFEKKKKLYLRICSQIGLRNEMDVVSCLSKMEANRKDEQSTSIHNFNRSISFTNNYWSKNLTEQEITKIKALSEDIENIYEK